MYNKDKVLTIPKYGLIASIVRSSFFEIPPFLHFFRVQKIHTNALEHVFNIFLMMIMKAIVSVPANYKANPRGSHNNGNATSSFCSSLIVFAKKKRLVSALCGHYSQFSTRPSVHYSWVRVSLQNVIRAKRLN